MYRAINQNMQTICCVHVYFLACTCASARVCVCVRVRSDKAPTNKICHRASSEQRPRTRSCHESECLVEGLFRSNVPFGKSFFQSISTLRKPV